MTRRELIITLLLRYEEALGGTHSTEPNPDSYPHMPSVWNVTYWELSRCLSELHQHDPTAYMHLKGRYCSPRRRQLRDVRLRHGRLQQRTGWPRRWHNLDNEHVQVVVGEPRTDIGVDVIVIQWGNWINPRHVQRGLNYVEREFHGEPMLPIEFVQAVAV